MPYVKGWALGAWCRRGGTAAAEEPASASASSSLPFSSTASSSSLASSSSTATTHTPPGIFCGGIGPSRWPLAYFSMTWTTKATDRMVIELSLSCPHLVRLGVPTLVTRSNMIPTWSNMIHVCLSTHHNTPRHDTTAPAASRRVWLAVGPWCGRPVKKLPTSRVEHPGVPEAQLKIAESPP